MTWSANLELGTWSINVSGWISIVQITAGGYYTVGVRSDAAVVGVGGDRNGQCNISGRTGIVHISAGLEITGGIEIHGSVVAAEYNGNRRYDVGEWDLF